MLPILQSWRQTSRWKDADEPGASVDVPSWQIPDLVVHRANFSQTLLGRQFFHFFECFFLAVFIGFTVGLCGCQFRFSDFFSFSVTMTSKMGQVECPKRPGARIHKATGPYRRPSELSLGLRKRF